MVILFFFRIQMLSTSDCQTQPHTKAADRVGSYQVSLACLLLSPARYSCWQTLSHLVVFRNSRRLVCLLSSREKRSSMPFTVQTDQTLSLLWLCTRHAILNKESTQDTGQSVTMLWIICHIATQTHLRRCCNAEILSCYCPLYSAAALLFLVSSSSSCLRVNVPHCQTHNLNFFCRLFLCMGWLYYYFFSKR